MTKDAKIWCSNLMMDTRAVKHIFYDSPIPAPADIWWRRCQRGEQVDPSELPDKLEPRGAMQPPPEVFTIANRVIVVRERVKTLLEGFALGRTRLYQVGIIRPGHAEPFEGPFYILNIAEHRSVFVPEQSKNVVLHPNGVSTIFGGGTKLDLAVGPEPPGDVDLWFHPNLADVIFLSAQLAAAIKAAQIRNFRLFPCREAA
jgi:hypothetical protein